MNIIILSEPKILNHKLINYVTEPKNILGDQNSKIRNTVKTYIHSTKLNLTVITQTSNVSVKSISRSFDSSIDFVMNGGWYSILVRLVNGDGSASVVRVDVSHGTPRFLSVTNRSVPSLVLIVLLCLHNNIDLIQLTLQCTLAMWTDLCYKKL